MFIFFCFNLIPKHIDQDFLRYDSSIVFEYTGSGFPIGDTPNSIRFEIHCKNSKINAYEIGIYNTKNGKKEKTKKVNLSCTNYRKIWKKLLSLDIWNLKTIDRFEFSSIETLYEHYKELRIGKDHNKFKFKLGNQNNEFEVYDLPMVKSPNYVLIVKEILAVFKAYIDDFYTF